MSESPAVGIIPTWTVGDRLGKALAVSGIGVAEMAEYLGLSRNSIGAYINDRQAPKRQTLMLWAMRTGVPLEWLETGEGPATPGPSTPPSGPGPRGADAVERLAAQKRARSASTRDNRRYEETAA